MGPIVAIPFMAQYWLARAAWAERLGLSSLAHEFSLLAGDIIDMHNPDRWPVEAK